jgi:hypothetical protein
MGEHQLLFNEKAKKRVMYHLFVALILFFIFVWPVAKLFNRIEPFVLGVPLYVFMEWILGPFLVFLNILAYLLWFERADKTETEGSKKEA